MVFNIMLADQIIKITSQYGKVYTVCQDYLYKNSIDAETISITTNAEDIAEVYFQLREMMPIKYDPIEYISSHCGHLESLAVYGKIADVMPFYHTFLMHGSVIACDNNAYMLTASSGTGKTTRTRLWKKEFPDSIIVNGDKPLIKLTENEAYACGTPWCGKEGWNKNVVIPLRAIILIERANEDEENSIYEISFQDAFISLLEQIHRPTDAGALRKTLQLLKSLEQKVRFYKFRSAPTPEGIRLAYETVRSK